MCHPKKIWGKNARNPSPKPSAEDARERRDGVCEPLGLPWPLSRNALRQSFTRPFGTMNGRFWRTLWWRPGKSLEG
eukprot:557647-Amphidinium_carterae.1